MTQAQIEQEAVKFSEKTTGGHHFYDLMCGFVAGAEWYAKNQWISVEDELPKSSDYVFVRLSCGRLPWTAKYENKMWKDVNNIAFHGVTHWMPIPSLKGDEK